MLINYVINFRVLCKVQWWARWWGPWWDDSLDCIYWLTVDKAIPTIWIQWQWTGSMALDTPFFSIRPSGTLPQWRFHNCFLDCEPSSRTHCHPTMCPSWNGWTFTIYFLKFSSPASLLLEWAHMKKDSKMNEISKWESQNQFKSHRLFHHVLVK